MLRQFLILWTIISMLSYSMVAAADIHLHTTTSNTLSQSDANIQSLMEVQTLEAHTDQGSLNEHCCHAGMHLIGLLDAFSHHLQVTPLNHFSPVNSLVIAYFPRSLLRPPQFS